MIFTKRLLVMAVPVWCHRASDMTRARNNHQQEKKPEAPAHGCSHGCHGNHLQDRRRHESFRIRQGALKATIGGNCRPASESAGSHLVHQIVGTVATASSGGNGMAGAMVLIGKVPHAVDDQRSTAKSTEKTIPQFMTTSAFVKSISVDLFARRHSHFNFNLLKDEEDKNAFHSDRRSNGIDGFGCLRS